MNIPYPVMKILYQHVKKYLNNECELHNSFWWSDHSVCVSMSIVLYGLNITAL